MFRLGAALPGDDTSDRQLDVPLAASLKARAGCRVYFGKPDPGSAIWCLSLVQRPADLKPDAQTERVALIYEDGPVFGVRPIPKAR